MHVPAARTMQFHICFPIGAKGTKTPERDVRRHEEVFRFSAAGVICQKMQDVASLGNR